MRPSLAISESIKAETTRLVSAMDRAVRDAGIGPSDPLAPLMEVLRQALAWHGDMTAEYVRLSVESSRLAVDLSEQVRRAFADVKMITPQGEQELVRRVAGMTGGAVREAMARVFRSLRWGVVSGIVAASVALCGVSGGVGWWLGHAPAPVLLNITADGAKTLVAAAKASQGMR